MSNHFFLLFSIPIFLLLELAYIRMARKFGVVDKPNSRTLHQGVVIRGGGVIFPLAYVLYFIVFFPKSDGYFLGGLLLISTFSFLDDLGHASTIQRVVVQAVAVVLMVIGLGLFQTFSFVTIVLLILVAVGAINAFNFMDGVNGMTGGYSLITLATLLFVNYHLPFISDQLLIILICAVLVFCLFNFRKTAICFSGDVGSISMAFILVYLSILLFLKTQSPLALLIFLIYGVDTVGTIVQRLFLRENIFKAHKRHLFQVMVDEAGLSHLQVSSLYMLIQLLVNVLVFFILAESPSLQLIVTIAVLVICAIVYLIVKFLILRAPLSPKRIDHVR